MAIQGFVKYVGSSASTRQGRRVTRDRAEAQRLAATIAAEARRRPESFASLVEQYSDAEPYRGGDMGVWSTREAFFSPVGLHVLSLTAEGVPTDVVDTPLGFALFRRQPPAPRTSYAADGVPVAYAGSAVDRHATRPREEALTLVRTLLDILKTDPGKFDSLRHRYRDSLQCQQPPITWWQGRYDPRFERLVAALPVGGIASEAIPNGDRILDPRREDEKIYQPTRDQWLFSIPAPAPPVARPVEYTSRIAAEKIREGAEGTA